MAAALCCAGPLGFGASAQADDAFKAATDALAACYLDGAKSTAGDPRCLPAAQVVETALASCRDQEDAVLQARKRAGMTSGPEIIANLRSSLRDALSAIVFTTRPQSCIGKP